jgi:hypothetical protein
MSSASASTALGADPASLDGETFHGPATTTATRACDFSEATESFSYHSEGDATGNYAGTYSEDGTVTIDGSENVVGWHADFTITQNGSVTVSGSKDFGPNTQGGSGFCGPDPGQNSEGSADGLVYNAQAPTGMDTGTSDAGVDSTFPEATLTLAAIESGMLDETFTSTSFTTGSPNVKQCRKSENQRHKGAVKSENMTHKSNHDSEEARHKQRLAEIKRLPKSQQAAARRQEDATHKANEDAENKRHHDAVRAEQAKHRQMFRACGK